MGLRRELSNFEELENMLDKEFENDFIFWNI